MKRDRLIKLLCDTHKNIDPSDTIEEHYTYVADHLIENGDTVNEWISVEDRFPEENTEVLIYCKTNSGKEVFFVDKIRYFRGLPIWQVWSGKVTHWMPLPEAPKGENNG